MGNAIADNIVSKALASGIAIVSCHQARHVVVTISLAVRIAPNVTNGCDFIVRVVSKTQPLYARGSSHRTGQNDETTPIGNGRI